MTDIIDLLQASSLHTLRWQARLSDLRRHCAARSELAATWDTVASLIDLDMLANDEICGPLYATAPQGLALYWELRSVHGDIHEIICETSLQTVNSPPWWLLISTLLSTWSQQLNQERNGPLNDCLRSTDPVRRIQIGLRWRAFREAWIRDRYPEAPPRLATCQMRLSRPAPPRLANAAFAPLDCTCPACDHRVARIPSPSLPGNSV